jgi:Tol biopolymer transport system component
MPWTSTTLYVADWLNGKLGIAKPIAGIFTRESILQPRWGPEGSLFFVSDRTGFWQIYEMRKDTQEVSITLSGLQNYNFSVPEFMLGT